MPKPVPANDIDVVVDVPYSTGSAVQTQPDSREAADSVLMAVAAPSEQ